MEADADTRVLMKRILNQLRVQHKAAEEDLMRAKAERASGHTEIRTALDLILNAKRVLLHGSGDQRRSIVLGLGSNWKIQAKKLQYECERKCHKFAPHQPVHRVTIGVVFRAELGGQLQW